MQWQNDRRLQYDARLITQLSTLDTVIARLNRTKSRADTLYLKATTIYQRTSDSVIREIAAVRGDSVGKGEAIAAAKSIKNTCDLALNACDSAQKVRDQLIDSLRRRSVLLEHHTTERPRFTIYGVGMSEFGIRGFAARTGSEYRLTGPLSLFVESELIKADSLFLRGRVGIIIRRAF
jgi:hypothetical protein